MYSDWHALGYDSVFYRKWHVYDLGWKDQIGDLSNYHICGAPLAGPVAVISVENKLTASPSDNKFYIFTSAGRKLAEVQWEVRKIAGVGWSDQEQLVIVLEDGKFYNIHIACNNLLFNR
jgi:hypothetical protein